MEAETSKPVLSEKIKMKDLLHQFDWSKTPLGNITSWDPSLRSAVSICIHAKSPMFVLWGKEFICIYNDAYRNILGNKHPPRFAAPMREIWSDLWEYLEPKLETILREGKSFLVENHPFVVTRAGDKEECLFTFSYSPIYSELNKVKGVFGSVTETTPMLRNEAIVKNTRNKQLDNLFLNAPIAMCILRGKDLVVEVANENMLEIWGKSAEEVLDKPLFEALSDVTNPGFETLLNNVYQKGERVVFDEIPVNFSGNGKEKSIFVKLTYEPIRERDGSIAGVMAVADEITNRVRIHKKIEESETKLRLAIESTKLGTWDYKPISGELEWSDECRKIFGVSAEQKIDFKFFIDHVYPADRQLVEQEIQRATDPTGNR